jgi:hypothetical protein
LQCRTARSNVKLSANIEGSAIDYRSLLSDETRRRLEALKQ